MPATTFAAALKSAREAAGLSQAALARRAGLTGSYVCVLEGKRKRPPSARVIAALCKALGIDDAPLQDLAALERSPTPVRRRLERMDRERGKAIRSRDRVLSTTLFHIAHRPTVMNPLGVGEFPGLSMSQQSLLSRLVGKVRRVGSAAEAEAKSAEILEEAAPRDREELASMLPQVLAAAQRSSKLGAPDLGAPTDDLPTLLPTVPAPPAVPRVPVRNRLDEPDAEEHTFAVDASLFTERAFLWRTTIDEAWPRIEPGDLLLVDPDLAPAPGDLVAFRDGLQDHVRTFARHGDEVRLLSPRADVPPIRCPASDFVPVGVVRWIFRSLR